MQEIFLQSKKSGRCHFANLPSRQQTRGNALISHADPTERGSFEVFGKIVKGLKRFCWFYNQWQAFMIILHSFNVGNINPNEILIISKEQRIDGLNNSATSARVHIGENFSPLLLQGWQLSWRDGRQTEFLGNIQNVHTIASCIHPKCANLNTVLIVALSTMYNRTCVVGCF